jgi:hypothetical protein
MMSCIFFFISNINGLNENVEICSGFDLRQNDDL